LKALSNLTSLTELNLSYTSVTNINLKEMASLIPFLVVGNNTSLPKNEFFTKDRIWDIIGYYFCVEGVFGENC